MKISNWDHEEHVLQEGSSFMLMSPAKETQQAPFE